MADQLNIIFDHFSIWFLCYRIEFSCLYYPQVLCGYKTQMNMFCFLEKVHL